MNIGKEKDISKKKEINCWEMEKKEKKIELFSLKSCNVKT
jgi:hypothetical protein